MALTKIEWAHFTFNAWRGCTKISPGCANCYADTLSKRNPKYLGVWGRDGQRVHGSDDYFRLPFKWNNWAATGTCYHCQGKGSIKVPAGRMKQIPTDGVVLTQGMPCPTCNGRGTFGEPYRARVFALSLGDVFEEASTLPPGMFDFLQIWRDELFALMACTPHLDWLLLTKRTRFAGEWLRELADPRARRDRLQSWMNHFSAENGLPPERRLLADELPWPLPNHWQGASFEDQKAVDERGPELMACPAAIRFASCEPLLSAINLTKIMGTRCLASEGSCCGDKPWVDGLRGIQGCKRAGAYPFPDRNQMPRGIDWVIGGGESGDGPNIRPVSVAAARSLRDQCTSAGVPFLWKQYGEWLPESQVDSMNGGGGPVSTINGERYINCGKVSSGRVLDGRTWDELPAVVGTDR